MASCCDWKQNVKVEIEGQSFDFLHDTASYEVHVIGPDNKLQLLNSVGCGGARMCAEMCCCCVPCLFVQHLVVSLPQDLRARGHRLSVMLYTPRVHSVMRIYHNDINIDTNRRYDEELQELQNDSLLSDTLACTTLYCCTAWWSWVTCGFPWCCIYLGLVFGTGGRDAGLPGPHYFIDAVGNVRRSGATSKTTL